jgi:hypothetical protein
VTLPEVALMMLLPEASPVANPAASIVATVVFDDIQVTELVRFAVDPSVKVPVAVNCSVWPSAMLGSAGVTAMEVTTAGVTVSVVELLMLPSVAVIIEVPVARVEANPVLDIVATVVFADAQTTEFVRFSIDPSLNVPVAVNCWVRPLATLGSAGVTAIAVTIAGVTVSVVAPLMPPSVAVMVDVPVASVVARPVLDIVATVVVADVQPTEEVRSSVDPSVKVPVAVNC